MDKYLFKKHFECQITVFIVDCLVSAEPCRATLLHLLYCDEDTNVGNPRQKMLETLFESQGVRLY